MKTLLLIRHAKSSWKSPELRDIERPLNNRGERDAPIMAKRLKERKIQPDLIVSSPAVRAKTTAMTFAKHLNYPTEQIQVNASIYDAAIYELFDVIRKLPNTADSVLIFGHNPSFTLIANYFSNHSIDNVPTCGTFAVCFKVSDWAEFSQKNSQFLFFDYPKSEK